MAAGLPSSLSASSRKRSSCFIVVGAAAACHSVAFGRVLLLKKGNRFNGHINCKLYPPPFIEMENGLIVCRSGFAGVGLNEQGRVHAARGGSALHLEPRAHLLSKLIVCGCCCYRVARFGGPSSVFVCCRCLGGEESVKERERKGCRGDKDILPITAP